MLSKVKTLNKFFQASSGITSISLQNSNKAFFASSSSSSYDADVASHVDSTKGVDVSKAGQKKVLTFHCLC